MPSEGIEGDAWGAYVVLARSAVTEHGMAYRTRVPWSRSHRSSRRWGEPIAWRRVAGGRHMNGGRVRDAQEPEPEYTPSTGELIDIERVTISLEGGRWKSTHRGNSLAAYPTARPVLRGGGGSDITSLPNPLPSWSVPSSPRHALRPPPWEAVWLRHDPGWARRRGWPPDGAAPPSHWPCPSRGRRVRPRSGPAPGRPATLPSQGGTTPS
jgi:hypothetical protein